MVFRKIENQDISRYYPWKISSDELQPNILLMCKMFVVLLWLNGFYLKINDPYIPFIRDLDFFNQYPDVFKISLRLGFIVFGSMLLFNIKTKWSSLFLGLVIITTLLASKPIFRNHIFIVGCVLFLVGLSKNKGVPWLIILQVSLLYLGASLNKTLQMDWWTGQFMQNWLGSAIENPIYNFISNSLPEFWFAKVLSWSSIFVELIIGLAILTKKWRPLGIWMMVIFHFAMFTMLAFRFGHFVEDLFILLMAFLIWPRENEVILYNSNKSSWLKNILGYLDWDKQYSWQEGTHSHNNYFEVQNPENGNYTKKPIIFLLLFSEGFYVLLLVFDHITVNLMYSVGPTILKILIHFVFSLVIWSFIFSYLYSKLKTKSTKNSFYKESLLKK